MYLTEKEARDKWCHQTMTPQALKRQDDLFAPAICSASECMAWRWGDPATKLANEDYPVGVGSPRVPSGPERRGFCGLAGMPEVE
jgi:hypothetical protein